MAQNNQQQYRFFRELASAQNLDLTESVFATLQDQGKGDADKMTDILMNWMMDDPSMKELMMEDRKRRQAAEEEARKKAEEERKKSEEARKKHDQEFIRLQEEAYQRLKKERELELQRRAAEEAKKRAEDEALAAAQKRLVEDAQKKVKDEEDRRRKAKEEEEAKRFADEASKFAADEARRRLAESQLKRDVKAAEESAARKLHDEEEAKKKALSAAAQKLAEEEAAKKAAAAAAAQKLAEEEAAKKAAAAKAVPAPAAAPAPAAVSEAKKKEDQAEYEKRLAELELRLAEFEKARTNKDSVSLKENSIASPKVCILTDNNTKEPAVAEVTAFLATKGVKPADIRVVNASNDFELVAIVKDQREKLEFPFVLVQNNAVGTFAELQAIAAKIGVLEALLAGEKVDPAVLNPKKSNSTETPPELRLGIYDYGVTVGEYTLKAVLLPIVAPYRLLSWAFGGKQPELEKGEDFDVLQSNWYWRHQLRTLRFTAEHIIRLRPGYNDVRAAHRYEDVKEIKLIDPTYFTISYREGGSDWYRTTPQDVRRVCEIICLKNRNVPNPLK